MIQTLIAHIFAKYSVFFSENYRIRTSFHRQTMNRKLILFSALKKIYFKTWFTVSMTFILKQEKKSLDLKKVY